LTLALSYDVPMMASYRFKPTGNAKLPMSHMLLAKQVGSLIGIAFVSHTFPGAARRTNNTLQQASDHRGAVSLGGWREHGHP
jgi:hypothetical protein